MPPILEFIIVGNPVTFRAKKKRKKGLLAKWKSKVKEEAAKHWPWPHKEPLTATMQCTLIHFHKGADSPLDNDNLSKPILDAMTRVIYEDDIQLVHTHVYQTDIDHPPDLQGATPILVEAISDGKDFIYIRFDPPQERITLPG